MKLFCFPYAGGIPTLIFSKWKSNLNDDIEIIPVDMPGRVKLKIEDSYDSVEEAVDQILKSLGPQLNGEFGFWGHSLGAIVAYELTRKMQDRNMILPKHVILSGQKPLHLKENDKAVHTYDDDEFVEEIYSLNGTKDRSLDNKEIRKLFLPMLRKDFKIVYNYKHSFDGGLLNVPLTAIMGSDEHINDFEKIQWHDLTNSNARILTLEGNHFFIHNNVDEIGTIIRESMR